MSASEQARESGIQDLVSTEEWQVRVDLAAAYRLVAHYDWDDLVFTHISARVPGPEHHFLINPYGMMFEEITASSLVKVDLNGNIVMASPYHVNPAGFTIHSAVHAAREDALCVIHLHTDHGIAISAQQDGLLPISQQALFALSSLGYHDYEETSLGGRPRKKDFSDSKKPRITHRRRNCGRRVSVDVSAGASLQDPNPGPGWRRETHASL